MSAAMRLPHFLGNAVIALVIVGSLAFMLPSLLGYERYVITGGSMAGTFEIGSVVFEEPVPVEDLRVGDVITYLPPAEAGIDNLVTHRIHRIRQTAEGETVYRTKGDANADVDPWTFRLESDRQPRMSFAVPAVGHVFIALADRATRIVVTGLPAALVALASLVQLLRALRPAPGPTGGARPAVTTRSA
ncbi:MAG TPA: signal peptidase I [Nocardioides sp.]|uniref:signal peptidase I n=1 Tax=Nocardioides sp. TaxID=35761 RepID=UPI002D7EA84A|nr:signal peptidase I [Nocardioides sp.]HET6651827.1 signal peptidase I [Nocardioides sp.]